jgi:hypothetical protein
MTTGGGLMVARIGVGAVKAEESSGSSSLAVDTAGDEGGAGGT